MKVLIINGPNLNLLGIRETHIYGNMRLENLNEKLKDYSHKLGIEIDFFQSNSEGSIIDKIQEVGINKQYEVIIINPAALSHTSLALRDCIAAFNSQITFIEIHISNIYSREEFRAKSLISSVCKGVITGFGICSYFLALDAIKYLHTGNYF